MRPPTKVVEDPLAQYRKALEHIEKKNAHIAKLLAERAAKDGEETPLKPTVSTYAAQRVPRGHEDVVHANEEWARQRAMHIAKKKAQLAREEAAEIPSAVHIDPQSAKICAMKNHVPVYRNWKDEVERRQRERERLAELNAPSFSPKILGRARSLSPQAGHFHASPSDAGTTVSSAVSGGVVERLLHDTEARNRRLQARRESAERERELREAEARRSKSACPVSRSRREALSHVEHLLQWQATIDARNQLRHDGSLVDPEASFTPQLSKRSIELAAIARVVRGHSLVPACSDAPPARRLGKNDPPRNRRTEVAMNRVKCAPLPRDFWYRNQRSLAAKQQREEALRSEIDSRNREACTFSPKISRLSAAIMSRREVLGPASSGGPDAAAPHYMAFTESAERHFTRDDDEGSRSSNIVPQREAPPPAVPLPAANASRRSTMPPSAPQHPEPTLVASGGRMPAETESIQERMDAMMATLAQWNALAADPR